MDGEAEQSGQTPKESLGSHGATMLRERAGTRNCVGCPTFACRWQMWVGAIVAVRRSCSVRYHALVMDKRHYYFKLIPPRLTFPADITEQEKALMNEHDDYCEQQFGAGKLLAYGPV